MEEHRKTNEMRHLEMTTSFVVCKIDRLEDMSIELKGENYKLKVETDKWKRETDKLKGEIDELKKEAIKEQLKHENARKADLNRILPKCNNRYKPRKGLSQPSNYTLP